MTLDTCETTTPSDLARRRMLSLRGEPMFLADWDRALMLHFEVDPDVLQHHVPYPLDLHQGRAFVSLVAFTLRDMRPHFGGPLTAWLFRPIATHEFLNVRTYVRHRDEPGIHFLAEWLTNRLAVKLGPRTFGLPYHLGKITYHHDWEHNSLIGRIEDTKTRAVIAYRAYLEGAVKKSSFAPCPTGALDEWLMERYTAFNCVHRKKKFFRVWHRPWPQARAKVESLDTPLLSETWLWMENAEFQFANFSPGLGEVWMGRPHRLKE